MPRTKNPWVRSSSIDSSWRWDASDRIQSDWIDQDAKSRDKRNKSRAWKSRDHRIGSQILEKKIVQDLESHAKSFATKMKAYATKAVKLALKAMVRTQTPQTPQTPPTPPNLPHPPPQANHQPMGTSSRFFLGGLDLSNQKDNNRLVEGQKSRVRSAKSFPSRMAARNTPQRRHVVIWVLCTQYLVWRFNVLFRPAHFCELFSGSFLA